MTLSAAIQAELPFLRREAEAQMSLTLRAYSPNGLTEDEDGYDALAFTDQGTCCGKVQATSSQGRDTATRYISIGEAERPVLEGGLHIPVRAFTSASGLLIKAGEQRGIGWEFVVESVNGLADCALLGRRYLVVEVPAKSFATARRLNVVEV